MELNPQHGAEALQKRFDEPVVLAAMNRLLDRIDALEATVATLSDLVRQAPAMTAMVTDMADDAIRKAADGGVDLDERLRNALHLAELLSRPDVVRMLEEMLGLAGQVPGMVAMVTDIADERIQHASIEGVDLPERIGSLLTLGKRLSDPAATAALEDVLSPEALRVVGALGKSLVASQQAPAERVGLMAALRRMKDPDVQRAMGFLLAFAGRFGRELGD